jgi:hypothetical protein
MKGVIKAPTIADCIRHGLENGVEVNPTRKGVHGEEWHCELKALCVEDVHAWYRSARYDREAGGTYPYGTLLFFSN